MTTKILLTALFVFVFAFAKAQDSTEVELSLSRGRDHYSVCYRYINKHVRKNDANITVFRIYPKGKMIIGRTKGTTRDSAEEILNEILNP